MTKLLVPFRSLRQLQDYLRYIDELYQTVEKYVDLTKIDKRQLEKIRRKYRKYKQDARDKRRLLYLTRRIRSFHLRERQFSPKTIKDSIREGELKTTKILKQMEKNR